jgi:Ca2+/H+ antiporter
MLPLGTRYFSAFLMTIALDTVRNATISTTLLLTTSPTTVVVYIILYILVVVYTLSVHASFIRSSVYHNDIDQKYFEMCDDVLFQQNQQLNSALSR